MHIPSAPIVLYPPSQSTYEKLGVALGSLLEGFLAGLLLCGAGCEAAGNDGGPEARGGAKGSAADDGRHGESNWGVVRVEWRVFVVVAAVVTLDAVQELWWFDAPRPRSAIPLAG